MSDFIKDELDKYVKYISALEGVLEIYLFGSYAQGTPNNNSDLDIMVVVQDSFDPIKTAFAINKGLFRMKQLPTDIAVNRLTDFRHASINSFFQKNIKEQGVMLYAHAEK